MCRTCGQASMVGARGDVEAAMPTRTFGSGGRVRAAIRMLTSRRWRVSGAQSCACGRPSRDSPALCGQSRVHAHLLRVLAPRWVKVGGFGRRGRTAAIVSALLMGH